MLLQDCFDIYIRISNDTRINSTKYELVYIYETATVYGHINERQRRERTNKKKYWHQNTINALPLGKMLVAERATNFQKLVARPKS